MHSRLINEYGVKNLIRIGTAGSLQEDIKIRSFVVINYGGINRFGYKQIEI